ncbi:MarR family transcriptional regulator [Specibacter cremeus]|uniref:MarR family transcriptional regulator n=1 Tax=Specibacter cremeus TaxID=1629051 RepID=UPI000F76FB94|nr:MarR family transcriptional regulator [Specibacter cremeus]
MFVVTIDQRDSRTGADRVPELLAQFSAVPVALPFERTVGDEIQGVLTDAAAVVAAAMTALRAGRWYVGVGVGPVDEPLAASSSASGGPAFIAARAAVDRAKKMGERVPLAVRSGRGGAARARASAAEAVLVLIGALVAHRSDAEWRVVDLLVPGVRGGQVEAAATLGISPQAVSRAVLRSGWQEEHAGRVAAAMLLELADA